MKDFAINWLVAIGIALLGALIICWQEKKAVGDRERKYIRFQSGCWIVTLLFAYLYLITPSAYLLDPERLLNGFKDVPLTQDAKQALEKFAYKVAAVADTLSTTLFFLVVFIPSIIISFCRLVMKDLRISDDG